MNQHHPENLVGQPFWHPPVNSQDVRPGGRHRLGPNWVLQLVGFRSMVSRNNDHHLEFDGAFRINLQGGAYGS